MRMEVLRVFLASPGDLAEERAIARAVVENVNRIVSTVNWRIELLGWEDTLPAFCRPQEHINRYVDVCDLFIGVLYRRWGQPTGTHSSGFEEEFLRARERRMASGKPEIWLFFKKVDEDSLRDPGDQLLKVLAFKNQQVERRELLFKEFDTTGDWKELLFTYLLKYVLELSRPDLASEPLRRSERTPAQTEASGSGSTCPPDLRDLFSRIVAGADVGKPIALDLADRARLHLVASAWLSEAYGRELLSVHQINLIYQLRRHFSLSREEIKLLFRTMVSDRFGVCPGWYWVRELPEEDLNSGLRLLACYDPLPGVRRGALMLLSEVGSAVPVEELQRLLQEDDEEVVLAGIQLIRSSGDERYLPVLDGLINSTNLSVRRAALSARIELKARYNPDAALKEVVDSQEDIPPSLVDKLHLVGRETLRGALQRGNASVRASVARHLRLSRMLAGDDLTRLVKDPDTGVVREALLCAIESQVLAPDFLKEHMPFLPWDDVKLAFLRSLETKELLSLVNWYTTVGPLAYRVLAEDHFESMQSRVRSDLDDGFESLRRESASRMVERFGAAFEPESWQQLNDFIRAKYIASALAGLVKHGEPTDVKWARKYLGAGELDVGSAECIAMLRKFGDASDAERLLAYARTARGETKRLAVRTALEKSPGFEGIVSQMLECGDSEIEALAVSALAGIRSANNVELARKKLTSRSADVRLRAAATVILQSAPGDVLRELNEYLGSETYYYDVVTWFDRCLFAPGRYRSAYREQLCRVIDEDMGREAPVTEHEATSFPWEVSRG